MWRRKIKWLELSALADILHDKQNGSCKEDNHNLSHNVGVLRGCEIQNVSKLRLSDT